MECEVWLQPRPRQRASICRILRPVVKPNRTGRHPATSSATRTHVAGEPVTTEGDEVVIAFYPISFLSRDANVSCYFRYLKNHPFEAVARKPKPTRRITVIRTPKNNVIMLPPWSYLFCVSRPEGPIKPELSGHTLRLSLQSEIPHRGQGNGHRCKGVA